MSEQRKPAVIFCQTRLAADFSPLTAMIAGDLVYWLSHKGNRWARYRDFADLFQVSERTVIRQRQHLEQIFIIEPTIMTKGNKKMRGANQYQLKPDHQGLLWTEDMAAPATANDSKVAAFPLVFVEIGKRANGGKVNIDLSWFLCRLANVIHSHDKGRPVTFSNWSSLESWTQTPPRTAKRYIALAEDAGLIKSLADDRPSIGITKKAKALMLGPFAVMDKQREQRSKQNVEDRMLGMIAFINEQRGHGDEVHEDLVDWFDRLCRREFGDSLSEFNARYEGWVDEDGNPDGSMGYDALVYG